MEKKTLLEEIQKIIRAEVRFLRHYYGEVISITDREKKGRVQVKIPELGWLDKAASPYVSPRAPTGLLTPRVGQTVEVYFMGGKKHRPVFLGIATEMDEGIPSLFTGDTQKQVLFEDAEKKEGVVYNRTTGQLELFGASEFAAMGEANLNFLTSLVNALNNFFTSVFQTHTHVLAGSAPPPSFALAGTAVPTTSVPTPLTAPDNGLLSQKVKLS